LYASVIEATLNKLAGCSDKSNQGRPIAPAWFYWCCHRFVASRRLFGKLWFSGKGFARLDNVPDVCEGVRGLRGNLI
jgi:hypothetical protein